MSSSSSPPPESGHGKEAKASPEQVILKPVKPEAAASAAAEGDGDGAFLNIKITSQTAPEVFVRVKRDYLMEHMIAKYCAKHSLDPEAVVFLNEEGTHIRKSQTVEEAGLEDGDSISVNMAQLGGSGRASV